MSITLAEFLELEARVRAGKRADFIKFAEAKSPESEAKLHEQILAECDRRVWGYVHSRMDRKTTNARGVCDFIILADGGRTFLIECKLPGKKFSQSQLIFETLSRHNGHTVHRVETIEEFLRLVA